MEEGSEILATHVLMAKMPSIPQIWVSGVNSCCSSLGDGIHACGPLEYRDMNARTCCSSLLYASSSLSLFNLQLSTSHVSASTSGMVP